MGWNGYGDDSRQAAAKLLARAQAGDMAAAAQLRQAAQTWAPNHRNAAIDAANQLDPNTGDDLGHIKNPHHGIGGFIGGLLKKAAPLVGLAIPGLGIPLSAGIAAAASAGGGALQGDKFNLLKTLAAGGAGAAGSLATGGRGFRALLGGGGGGAPGTAGDAATATGGGGGGGGWKDSLMRAMGIGGGGGFDPMKLAGAGASIWGAVDAHNRANQANDAMSQARGMATNAYQARQPLEGAANSALLRAMGTMDQPSEAGGWAAERMKRLGQRAVPTNPALARAMG